MPLEPLAVGVCSWSLQVTSIPELKRLMDRLGVPATTRASFGAYNDVDDIDRLVEALHDARKVFRLG